METEFFGSVLNDPIARKFLVLGKESPQLPQTSIFSIELFVQEMINPIITENGKTFNYHFALEKTTISDLGRIFGGPTTIEVFEEVFWDTQDHLLSQKNITLGSRNNEFTLKVCNEFPEFLQANTRIEVMPYKQFSEQKQIVSELQSILKLSDLGEDPTFYCPYPIATFFTVRHHFKKTAPLSIYLDNVCFSSGEFYLIGTLQTNVRVQQPHQLVEMLGANVYFPVRSKLLEFLHRKNPTVYEIFEKHKYVGSEFISITGLNISQTSQFENDLSHFEKILPFFEKEIEGAEEKKFVDGYLQENPTVSRAFARTSYKLSLLRSE